MEIRLNLTNDLRASTFNRGQRIAA